MAKCTKIYRNIDKICVGSLNKKIILYVRNITNKPGQFADFMESFTDSIETWAMVETTSGVTVFDDVNQERVVSHNFYIRYRDNLTSENWLEYDGRFFDILSIDKLNEDKIFLKLLCAERGIKTVEANTI